MEVFIFQYTVFPGSSDQFYIVTYYVNMVTTSLPCCSFRSGLKSTGSTNSEATSYYTKVLRAYALIRLGTSKWQYNLRLAPQMTPFYLKPISRFRCESGEKYRHIE